MPLVPYALNAFSLTPTGLPGLPSAFTLALLMPITGNFGTFGSIGFDTLTVNGQGFHGIQRDFYTGGSGSPLTGRNMIIRVSGNMIIPVELLEFEVE